LPSVIDCLRFFFLFSLMTTKVHDYSFFFIFLSNQKCFSYPSVYQSCQTCAPDSKNLIFFKSTIGLQKQTLSHSSKIFHLYAVELNCKLFFICATYFINLLYLKRKEWKKKLSSKWFISSFQKKNFFFLYALWMKILILCFHPSVWQFFKGFILF
jgi:hypothetical protein